MNTLGFHAGGRDNNFNLLRFVAAAMVLVSHSYAIATGDAAQEPLRSLLGFTIGTMAVDIFFVASGFLVAGSMISRPDLFDFLAARALRIFPGLWVALIVTVVVVGIGFTTLAPLDFATHRETWKYLAKNAFLLRDVSFSLPGAFEHNPYRGAVNGSLWTLPRELQMYLILAAGWVVLGLARGRRLVAFKWFCVGLGAIGVVWDMSLFLMHRDALFPGLLARFFMGAAIRVLKDRIPASKAIFYSLLIVLVLAAMNATVFNVVYKLGIGYLVLYFALVPTGAIRLFNRFGDYSYGIYIYAFPIQQALAAMIPGIRPIPMLGLSLVTTTAFAYASWVLVEERGLKLKSRIHRWRAGSRFARPQTAREAGGLGADRHRP